MNFLFREHNHTPSPRLEMRLLGAAVGVQEVHPPPGKVLVEIDKEVKAPAADVGVEPPLPASNGL